MGRERKTLSTFVSMLSGGIPNRSRMDVLITKRRGEEESKKGGPQVERRKDILNCGGGGSLQVALVAQEGALLYSKGVESASRFSKRKRSPL